jgi:hypothetical protein
MLQQTSVTAKSFIEMKLQEAGWRKANLCKKIGISTSHLDTALNRSEKNLFPPQLALKIGAALDIDPMEIMTISVTMLLEQAKPEIDFDKIKETQFVYRADIIGKIDEIKRYREAGMSYNQIAEKIGVKSGASICTVLKRHS